MFGLNTTDRFMLCNVPTDMRKSFDGLCGMIESSVGQSPTNGTVFIFINKGRDKIKLLQWMPGGFVLYYKRLEEGTFQVPYHNLRSGSIKLSYVQLAMLIDGISIKNLVHRRRFSSTIKSV
ncbi:MAG: transposase [Bacteroidia bacterium]|jgi:transposase